MLVLINSNACIPSVLHWMSNFPFRTPHLLLRCLTASAVTGLRAWMHNPWNTTPPAVAMSSTPAFDWAQDARRDMMVGITGVLKPMGVHRG